MNDARRSRVVLLVVLAVIGLSLAGVGSVIGVTQSLTSTDPSAEFVVTEDNITVEGGGQSRTLVSNMTNVRNVSIAAVTDGHFTVDTTEASPLTAAQRTRAEEIALGNEAVRTRIRALDEYRIAVSAVQRINASAFETESIDVTDADREGNGSTFVIRTNGTLSGEYDRSVSIRRDATYVEDRATVRVYRPGNDDDDELAYSVDVDLANETVTDVTDWSRIHENSETVTVTGDDEGATVTDDSTADTVTPAVDPGR